jgi:lysyl-tRNA synthetase class 2
LLREGDLIAIKVTAQLGRNSDHDRVDAEAVLLLTPYLDESGSQVQSDFDVQRSVIFAQFLQQIRSYFMSHEFVEAWTPTLVPSPGTEPFLEPFVTHWEYGSVVRDFYLPTSPEFHLKKMLVRGWTRVFEIKSCFRNGEIGPHHQPEFLMLEWYRAYSDLDAIADDVENLLAHLQQFVLGRLALAQDLTNSNMNSPLKLKRVTMAELFAEKLNGFQLTPGTTREDLLALAAEQSIHVDEQDSWDDLFFRIFLEKIETELGHDGPLLVRGYPPSQAALSRLGTDGFADRFEIYWRGLEIANAFHELNDPVENERRFADDAVKKRDLGKKAVPIDQELVSSIYRGMPPSGGIALGVERLFMALMNIQRLQQVRAFPCEEPS